KNSMTKRAIEGTDLEGLSDTLAGPTAIAFGKEDVVLPEAIAVGPASVSDKPIAFGKEDVVLPAKILADFAKDHKDLEIKGGVIEGKVATLEEIQELSKLPDYDGLVSMLLSVLQAPIR